MSRRHRLALRFSRDAFLFVLGVLGIVHETLVYAGDVRTELLILFGGMVGLPAFLGMDGAKQKQEDS